MSRQKEVIIVGGGIVGMLMALALSKSDHKVTLIDKKNVDVKQDNRSIALSYSSLCVLNSLGLWRKVISVASLINHVHVSDKGAYGQLSMNAEDERLPFFGAVIPMRDLLRATSEVLNQYQTFHWLESNVTKVLDGDKQNYALKIMTEEKTSVIGADLIIAADGANSFVRTSLNIDSHIHDYQQSAIVFDVSLKRSHNNWAYERFIGDGVMAMLPLTDNRCACVWTVNHEAVPDLLALERIQFVKKVQQVFGYRLGQFIDVTTPQAFPLSLVQANMLYKRNVLMFGNASHFLHPISGQGLNLSIRDIGVLYDLLGCDQSIEVILQKYQELRQYDHRRTAKLTHGLIESFSDKTPVWQKARSFALHLLHRDTKAKSLFSQLMMGKFTQGSTLNSKRVL